MYTYNRIPTGNKIDTSLKTHIHGFAYVYHGWTELMLLKKFEKLKKIIKLAYQLLG
jgi:hypothetical protein